MGLKLNQRAAAGKEYRKRDGPSVGDLWVSICSARILNGFSQVSINMNKSSILLFLVLWIFTFLSWQNLIIHWIFTASSAQLAHFTKSKRQAGLFSATTLIFLQGETRVASTERQIKTLECLNWRLEELKFSLQFSRQLQFYPSKHDDDYSARFCHRSRFLLHINKLSVYKEREKQ